MTRSGGFLNVMAIAGAGRTWAGSHGSQGWFRGLTLATTLSVFALLVLGGVVRVTGSGLGCPDWPLCEGGLLPPADSKAIIEFSHRVVASFLVGPLVVATFLSAWISQRRQPWLVWPATVMLALVLAQAGLGGVTVLNELPGETVMAHLALGEALLGLMALITVVAHRGAPRLDAPSWARGKLRSFPSLLAVSAAASFVLLLSGSYVTISGSTGACLDWPLCNGDAFPGGQLQLVHMVHRYVALIVGLLVLYTLHLGFRRGAQPPEIRALSLAAAALFGAQVLAGAGAVWTDFSQEFRGLHLGVASAFWGVLTALLAGCFCGQDSRETFRQNSGDERRAYG